jgi:hypothetical protein
MRASYNNVKIRDEPFERDCAEGLGRYPSCWTTLSTSFLVSSLTAELWFIARDTVAILTPAVLAISLIVTEVFEFFISIILHPYFSKLDL